MISLSPQLDFARRRQSSVRRCSPQAVLSPRRQRRRAFTLIEILAVLGVILILMALFFGGMKKWSESSKRQLTVTRLEMLQSAFNELEAAGHNTFQQQWFIGANGTPQPIGLDASQIGNLSPVSSPSTPEFAMISGAQQTVGVSSLQNALNYMVFPALSATNLMPPPPLAVCNVTSISPYMYTPKPYGSYASGPVPYGIMPRLMTLPTFAKAIASLPSTAIVSATMTVGGVTITAPVVLDGWGNPILFVPGSVGNPAAGGMMNVYSNTGTNSWVLPATPIFAPDNRPFFVSAGPDGDFLKGDDNIYSFDAK